MRRAVRYKAGMKRTMISIAVAAGILGGCVEREMTLTTNPPGALVYVSEKEIGRTPVTLPFLWYGDYEIVIRRDGFQTLYTHADLCPPIYETFPLDLLSTIVPWTFHDRRYLHFTLAPSQMATDEELIRRAASLRRVNNQPVER
jgi:hypothetical protein